MLQVTYEARGIQARNGDFIPTYMVNDGTQARYPLPRISSLIGTLHAPGLEEWKLGLAIDQTIEQVQLHRGWEPRDAFKTLVHHALKERLSQLGEESQRRKADFFQEVRTSHQAMAAGLQPLDTPAVRALREAALHYDLRGLLATELVVGSTDPPYAGTLDFLFQTPTGELVAVDVTLKSPSSSSMNIGETDRLRAVALALAVPLSTPYNRLPDGAICIRIDPDTGTWTDGIAADGMDDMQGAQHLLRGLSRVYEWRQAVKRRVQEEKGS